MSTEDKAKELIEKFKAHSYYDAHDLTSRRQREESNIDSAKECAEICVDEIIKELQSHVFNYDMDSQFGNVSPSRTTIPYWLSVKEHIQNYVSG